ncbi:hypothetical protein VP01_14666g1 [Puccinia sorghi]|uniref:Uncharacterized protein n=1 Tax=Puccinia sorghi TaxID=27349 RepID=A0A0L6VJR9_9BASI|nr:hypothetical protein VP01_14666g1 [Puccinia sorghi]
MHQIIKTCPPQSIRLKWKPMKLKLERNFMDVEHKRWKTPGKIVEAPGKKNQTKSKESEESAVVSELDSLKIPTTFSQLTAILPTYFQELIEKLQHRLPGQQISKLSYIKGKGQG